MAPVGWMIPGPSSAKGAEQLRRERQEKVAELCRRGLLHSERLRVAMLTVRREDFVPAAYRNYAYQEVPLPLPGLAASISCPHSYPLFYEALGLEEGHRFLEIGLGSGYGAALAREVVGPAGLVVSVEIDRHTLAFAKGNLERAGYTDIVCVLADGGQGWPADAPYDRICVTAACQEVPLPLIDQLKVGGRLILPQKQDMRQVLTLVEKTQAGIRTSSLVEVLYVDLQGRFGPGGAQDDATLRPALVVTCSGLSETGHTRTELHRALPEARVRGAGFRGILCVFCAGEPVLLAERVTRSCQQAVARVTAVLAETPSDRDSLLDAAVRIATEQVGPHESFAFRIHKRGRHGYVEPTPELESDIGGQIAEALERRDGSPPRVVLGAPDVLINAEVLGLRTFAGLFRRSWREGPPGGQVTSG